MAAASIHLQFDAGPLICRIPAGPCTAASDRELAGCEAMRMDSLPLPAMAEPASKQPGRGWIADAERDFVLLRYPRHSMLDAAQGALAWSHDGTRVWLPRVPLDPRTAIEFGFGIGLVAALSERAVFCLHASAVCWRGGALAVMGASGAGKSTFARALDRADSARRIADDILPLDANASAWPAFPQLKLDPSMWWPAHAGALPLRAIALLSRAAQGSCTQLDTRAAMRALLERTAGARTFSPTVHQAHLAHCAAIARDIPVYALQVADCADDPDAAAHAAFAQLQTSA